MTWKRESGKEDSVVLDFQFPDKRNFTKVAIFTSNMFSIGAQVRKPQQQEEARNFW